jgi:hypothetical protein
VLTKEGPVLLEGIIFAGLMCTSIEKPHSYIGIIARAAGMDGADLLDEIVQAAVTEMGWTPRNEVLALR